ncbi:MAG: hypothetical protein JWQ43_2913 [Glaciihabitans sp.]|nr:hypothetical protein [Glaciihabitans sp.]
MATAPVDDYIANLDEPRLSLARTLRDHLDASLPTATSAIWEGSPVWMINSTPIAGFKADSDRVVLLLWRAEEIDAHGAMAAAKSGKPATLALETPAQLHGPELRKWLSAAKELEGA